MNSGRPGEPAVEFSKVEHGYRPALGSRVPALAGFSLRVPRGKICGLIGPNGSGKSTALKLAAGLLQPDVGAVLIGGRPAGKAPVRGEIGYAPEASLLPAWLSVAELLETCGRLAGLAGAVLRNAVAREIERAGLGALRERSAAALSKGQRQRLVLAQSLLHEPAVLLLDEPATGLDPVGVAELTGLLGQLRAEGKTVLMASHFLRQVEEMCDAVCLLRDGRVLWQGGGAGDIGLAERYLVLARQAPRPPTP